MLADATIQTLTPGMLLIRKMDDMTYQHASHVTALFVSSLSDGRYLFLRTFVDDSGATICDLCDYTHPRWWPGIWYVLSSCSDELVVFSK